MRITTVIGARPQFVKASFLSRRFKSLGVNERLIHTGQHYDSNMSDVFFSELRIPAPDANLGVGGQGHGAQTGQMLAAIENDLNEYSCDAVMVYGDTNSTLAGALAAAKLHIPVIHIEAGLRSFDKRMPEEINRILTDHVSSLLLCPNQISIENLRNEGISKGAYVVGDVMHRVLMYIAQSETNKGAIYSRLALDRNDYYLATIHRADNTDNDDTLLLLMKTLSNLDSVVVCPLHPRTLSRLDELGWENHSTTLKIIEPVGYLDMIALIEGAQLVLTDSGGLQKEAAWLSTPCITLRDSTEWTETVESGWNRLVGNDPIKILKAVSDCKSSVKPNQIEIKSYSAEQIVELIKKNV